MIESGKQKFGHPDCSSKWFKKKFLTANDVFVDSVGFADPKFVKYAKMLRKCYKKWYKNVKKMLHMITLVKVLYIGLHKNVPKKCDITGDM